MFRHKADFGRVVELSVFNDESCTMHIHEYSHFGIDTIWEDLGMRPLSTACNIKQRTPVVEASEIGRAHV